MDEIFFANNRLLAMLGSNYFIYLIYEGGQTKYYQLQVIVN